MTEKTFSEGVDELQRMVGAGVLAGEVSVNQAYSRYQDGVGGAHGPRGKPSFAFDHPRGGQAMFLSGPIRYRRSEVFQRWANAVLRGRLVHETIDILHSFKDDVSLNAPREFDILRNSTALKLSDDGAPVFDLPALIPRLSDAELKVIRKSVSPAGNLRSTMRGRRNK